MAMKDSIFFCSREEEPASVGAGSFDENGRFRTRNTLSKGSPPIDTPSTAPPHFISTDLVERSVFAFLVILLRLFSQLFAKERGVFSGEVEISHVVEVAEDADSSLSYYLMIRWWEPFKTPLAEWLVIL